MEFQQWRTLVRRRLAIADWRSLFYFVLFLFATRVSIAEAILDMPFWCRNDNIITSWKISEVYNICGNLLTFLWSTSSFPVWWWCFWHEVTSVRISFMSTTSVSPGFNFLYPNCQQKLRWFFEHSQCYLQQRHGCINIRW